MEGTPRRWRWRGEARRRCTQDRDRTGTEVIARHLQGVVEGGAGWVQSEVLEGLDPGLAPALLPAPLHHQHVVRERLPEHQGIAGAGLLSWLLRYLQQQVCSLRKDGTFRCPGIWSQVSKLSLPQWSLGNVVSCWATPLLPTCTSGLQTFGDAQIQLPVPSSLRPRGPGPCPLL